jgi:hypothetical protein
MSLSKRQLIEAVARQLEPQQVASKPVSFGNQPPNARFFSTRPDIQPHFHKPGAFYCGTCMQHVRV